MDLPIFIGNTYFLFVAKVLDPNVVLDFLRKVCYNWELGCLMVWLGTKCWKTRRKAGFLVVGFLAGGSVVIDR